MLFNTTEKVLFCSVSEMCGFISMVFLGGLAYSAFLLSVGDNCDSYLMILLWTAFLPGCHLISKKNTKSFQPPCLTQGPLISTACLAKVKLSFFLLLQLPSTLPLTHPCDTPLPIQIQPRSNWRYVWAVGWGW